MKASENGHADVVKFLAEHEAKVNAKSKVSCVHQPELTLLLCGVCLVCTVNMYITTVMMLEC